MRRWKAGFARDGQPRAVQSAKSCRKPSYTPDDGVRRLVAIQLSVRLAHPTETGRPQASGVTAWGFPGRDSQRQTRREQHGPVSLSRGSPGGGDHCEGHADTLVRGGCTANSGSESMCFVLCRRTRRERLQAGPHLPPASVPHKVPQPMPDSVRSYLAAAIGGGSNRTLGPRHCPRVRSVAVGAHARLPSGHSGCRLG